MIKGSKHTEQWKKQLSEHNEGSNNANWRGDKICKYQKHERIEKQLGVPKYCEICKRSDKKKYEWSNKDHKYSLNLKDWQRLCTSCHRKYDMKYNGLKIYTQKINSQIL